MEDYDYIEITNPNETLGAPTYYKFSKLDIKWNVFCLCKDKTLKYARREYTGIILARKVEKQRFPHPKKFPFGY